MQIQELEQTLQKRKPRQAPTPHKKTGYHTNIKNPFLKHVWNRTHYYNQNWVWAIVGATGSGKSLASIWNAKILDPQFNINRIAWNLVEFLEILYEQKLPQGSTILLEELGVNADNRQWYTLLNKAFTHIMQVMRTQNYVVFMTLPNLNWMDKKGRGSIHCLGEMQYIDHAKNKSYMKVKTKTTDPKTGKHYYKYPRIPTPTGRKVMELLECGHIKTLDPQLHKQYEKKRKQFDQEKGQEMLTQVRQLLQKQEGKMSDGTLKGQARTNKINQIVGDLTQNPEKGTDKNGKWNSMKIKANYDISMNMAREIRHKMKLND